METSCCTFLVHDTDVSHCLLLLQLLGGLLEVNPSFVRAIEEVGLAHKFFEFLSLEHSNNNVHNIRLCRQIILSSNIPATELMGLQVAEKVGDMNRLLCL